MFKVEGLAEQSQCVRFKAWVAESWFRVRWLAEHNPGFKVKVLGSGVKIKG